MHLLQFFAYESLTPDLQAIAKPFHTLAVALVEGLPENPERTAALRKLLEARDAAFRAHAFKWSSSK